MQYETRIVDAERGIVQVTTSDERWYGLTIDGKLCWVPSATWICEYYPKGIAFLKWLASKGWDEAEALKEAGGERGRYVHLAVQKLLRGEEIAYNSIIDDRELTTEEYAAVLSFSEWYDIYKPVVKNVEYTVYDSEMLFAGTLDLDCEIENEPWIIDFKTSQDVWPSFEIQLSMYRKALRRDSRLGILQLGYKRNKKQKYKFTEIEYQPELVEATYRIWKKETNGIQPLQREYPLVIKLNGGKDETT